MPRRKEHRQCQQCGNSFESCSGMYCCRQCYYASILQNGRVKRQRQCEQCYSAYIPRQKKIDKNGCKYTRFCSRVCSSHWRRDSLAMKTETKACLFCGQNYCRVRHVLSAEHLERDVHWDARMFCSVRCARMSRGIKSKFDAFSYFRACLKKNTKRDARGCLIWTGKLTNRGYGVVCSYYGRNITAHRVSYVLHIGPIVDKLFVRHHCDVRACCEPRHLVLGTHIDNMRDMLDRKRASSGERHHNAINREVAKNIERDMQLGTSLAKVSRKYGHTITTCLLIKRKKHWSNRKP